METRLHPQQKAAPPPSFTPVRGDMLQRKCACSGATRMNGECDGCSKQSLSLQRSTQTSESETRNSGGVPPIVHEVLRSSGQPLDADTRAFMEPRFGHDFSNVRVHTDTTSAGSARALNAMAYTAGSDVVFAMGQYAPRTTEGKKLIAHELTHVLQQDNASDSSLSKLELNAHEDAAEAQADEIAESILRDQQIGEDKFSLSRCTLQRKPDGGRSNLQAPQFKGDRVLEACLVNLHTLKAGLGDTVGDQGEAVKKVQQALVDLGFELPKFGVDGLFGPETKAAVEAFQRSQGFTGDDVDGKIGPKTMDALDASFPPRKTAPAKESRTVPSKVEVTTVEKGEIEGEKKKDAKVKTETQGTQTVSSSGKNPEGDDEPAFQFTAEIDVQNKWQVAGSPGDKPEACDFGAMQIGGKWNWTGVPLGTKLSLFSEPELDVNLLPLFCGKAPGITLQDNILKWSILKDVWELSLVGAFGLKDGWLKDWKDKPLTGLVGPELDWKPWGEKKNVWYKGLKFKLSVNSVWEKAPEGKKDLWGVQASGGIGLEIP